MATTESEGPAPAPEEEEESRPAYERARKPLIARRELRDLLTIGHEFLGKDGWQRSSGRYQFRKRRPAGAVCKPRHRRRPTQREVWEVAAFMATIVK